MRTFRSGMLFGGLLLVAGSVQLAAQVTYPNVKIAGRLQTQAYYFSNDDSSTASATGPQSNMFIRRARIQANGNITETVSFVIQPSFEEGSTRLRLRDAYIDVGFQRGEPRTRFTLRMGQEKRPFGRYELTSSNNLPSIERGAGKGLVKFSSNDLFTTNGFLSHDVGAALLVASKINDAQMWTLQVGAYTGEGESKNDVNNAKSFAVRATVGVTSKLNIGGSFLSHESINTDTSVTGGVVDSSYKNNGFGVDASWGRPGDEGLYLVGDYMRGESRANNNIKAQGISLVGAWHIRMKDPNAFLYGIEPAVRFDMVDPDTDTNDDGGTIITAGINLYLSSRAQLRAAYEHQSFQNNAIHSIGGVRTAFTVNF